ncbi:tetratricopeptide (TPR) repeat protein [Allocatelliglobosispora scoriae]|uniref:Tetratricopeptide (TPR) repeat protein n=1 Tax=Allocatelliglobosispora scoriae TaxID=643052 RepID=A0A841BHQ7_9ACTN|nr:CHAT domain-containing protein [Allocatelliglobosispora scoriae]MBB5868637.1 tetratricopeptide (TPR) repeat protein [Allocatelliglobosispora scoriae]
MVDVAPRIFLSYAHDSAEHQQAVKDLWWLLRELGIDAKLDIADEQPGQNWPIWMQQQIDAADFVLVIASPEYRRRADGEAPPDEGRGVWYEAHLLRDMVYDSKGGALRRILPVVLPGRSAAELPRFFGRATSNHFVVTAMTEPGLGRLLGVLLGEPGTTETPLGRRRQPAPLVHELAIDVTVDAGRLHSRVELAGTLLSEQDAAIPLGLADAWSVLRRPPLEAGGELAERGRALTAALFDPDALARLTSLITESALGTAVDVVVTTDGAGLALPYELMRLADDRAFATVAGVRLTRHVRGIDRADTAPVAGPLKILAAVAAPERTSNQPLDVEAEMQAIISVTQGLDAEVTILEVASPQQIANALRRDPYHVLHLSAHGSPVGLEMEDEDGNAVPVVAADLVKVLRHGNRPVPLIVLSSCAGAGGGDTGLAATLVRQGADRVIAAQTTISDPYATALMSRVYQRLATANGSVAEALAFARTSLFDEATAATARTGHAVRPEHGVMTLLTSGSDARLCDPAATVVHLRRPMLAPSGAGVRELALGELIGRRGPLRRTLRALRDDPRSLAEHGQTCGVALTGIGGIGKTALAGRVIARLSTDVEPWSTAVHIGEWNPSELLIRISEAVGDPRVSEFLLSSADDADKLALVFALLSRTRLLLVFDDFERNLTVGGDRFKDPGFAEIFARLCDSTGAGRVLVTCRYPIPDADDLLNVDIPPLTPAELDRLLRRLPAVDALVGDDRRIIIETIGGHPRLMEFADALLRGQSGRGRLREVAVRLRRLAADTEVRIPKSKAGAPGAAEAARQVVLLGSRDILLDELLALLTGTQRELLLQAAVSRMPLPLGDLILAVHGEAPSSADARRTAEDADRLIDLTLLATVEGELQVHTWVNEALGSHQGVELMTRQVRAIAMHIQRLDSRRAIYSDLTELGRHYAAVGDFDNLAHFALDVCRQLPGELTVAAFLNDLRPMLADDHPLYLTLLDREREALANTGNSIATSRIVNEMLRLTRSRASADPADIEYQRDLSIALNRLGDLARAAGDMVTARASYTESLTMARRLTAADPTNIQYQRDLSVSLTKLGDLARAAGDMVTARTSYTESLTIDRQLTAADPTNIQYQRDLSISMNKLGDLAQAAGDIDAARTSYTESLTIRRQLTTTDPTNIQYQRDLSISMNKLGDLAQAAGDIDAARTSYTESLTIRRQLTAADPTNLEYQRDLSVSLNRLGDLAQAAGDIAAARSTYTENLNIARKLTTTDPTNIQYQRDLSYSLTKLGDLAEELGDMATARASYAESLTIDRQLTTTDPTNIQYQRDLSISLSRAGLLEAVGGNPTESAVYIREARAIVQRLSEINPADAQYRQDITYFDALLEELTDR